MYVDLLKKYGLFGVSSNGFNENFVLFLGGKCGMWIDVIVVVGMVSSMKDFKVVDKVGFVNVFIVSILKGLYWLWIWVFVVLKLLKLLEVVKMFVVWVILKDYICVVVKV